MAAFIEFILGNFTLTLLIVGFTCSIIDLSLRQKPRDKRRVIEAFFSYFLLFSMGLGFLYNFILHVFFADMAASFIGWKNSPFQYEVGYASLGFAVVGMMTFKQSLSFRAAAVIGPALFLWGAAGGHIYQMITAHNFAPGDAGVIFWTDVFLPIVAFVLLYQQFKQEKLAFPDRV